MWLVTSTSTSTSTLFLRQTCLTINPRAARAKCTVVQGSTDRRNISINQLINSYWVSEPSVRAINQIFWSRALHDAT